MYTAEHAQWYQDAIIYQLHVRAFYDSNEDGIGDFAGLTRRLGYLKDLGVTAIWLLPFYRSPLKDDGYDISDYLNINPMYGDLNDFKRFLRVAHRLGLRVITELVLNHTSDQHPWFQRARRAPAGSPERDFYMWSDTPEKFRDARIIFKDFEPSNWTWDPVAGAYYWHRFYANQPDLNFNNPQVRKAMFRVVDYWLALGVDGLRLDAVPYLYEKDGTNCENLPETHVFLKSLRTYVDSRYPDRMLLAEANQWPEDAMSYFGNGDECHMCFHFPLMPRLFMALEMEDRFPIVDIIEQTPQIPEKSQWAIFLRNHDELTLEMVTDEERDYMYRIYAVDARARINLGIRRRLAPLLGNNLRKIELLNGLLFSVPGTPIVYYGDEIGMGDNIYLGDRNGVRTPLQWSSDRNSGFSRANAQQLFLPVVVDHEFHYEAVNIENQQRNPNSLLWWMKRLISLKKDSVALRRGKLRLLHPENRKVFCLTREYGDEVFLMVANMSRNVQCVELDLSAFRGRMPQELFGKTNFPRIGERPYFITLGSYQFYWFQLHQEEVTHEVSAVGTAPLKQKGSWKELFDEFNRPNLEEALPAFLRYAPWYLEKRRMIKQVEILRSVQPHMKPEVFWCIVRVQYHHGESEMFLIPLSFVRQGEGCELEEQLRHAIVLKLQGDDRKAENNGLICDSTAVPGFGEGLFQAMSHLRRQPSRSGDMSLTVVNDVKKNLFAFEPKINRIDSQSVVYSDRLFFRLFRKIERGVHPTAEAGLYFSTIKAPLPVPTLVGLLELQQEQKDPKSKVLLGILETYVTNKRRLWDYTLDLLARYYETVLTLETQITAESALPHIAPFLPAWSLLGQRLRVLHDALALGREDPAFCPESFSELYQRSLYQSLRVAVHRGMTHIRQEMAQCPPQVRIQCEKLLTEEARILQDLRTLIGRKMTGLRIRIHGDMTLHKALFTGKDFFFVDFEGDLSNPWGEHRIKRSPLVDVASMMLSFRYAADHALHAENIRLEDRARLGQWKNMWIAEVTSAFLKSYFYSSEKTELFPSNEPDQNFLLSCYQVRRGFRDLTRSWDTLESIVGLIETDVP